MLVPTGDSKYTIKKYEKPWNKIRDLIRSITNSSDNYDEKYRKIKFNSDDDLPLEKTIELHNMVIVMICFFMRANITHKSFR